MTEQPPNHRHEITIKIGAHDIEDAISQVAEIERVLILKQSEGGFDPEDFPIEYFSSMGFHIVSVVDRSSAPGSPRCASGSTHARSRA